MRKIILIFVILVNTCAYSQDDKTVTLVVSGQGKTQEEARQVALRSAIELAFGTFISSKTEIMNDNLVKDEIVSITNGNIQQFVTISEVQLPDSSYASTLKATVSVTKLNSFCESKGVQVEFKGALFAMNIKLQKLNEEAELKSVLSLIQICKEILNKSLDFSLQVTDPVYFKSSNSNGYKLDLNVTCKTNENYLTFQKYFIKSLSKIALSDEDYEIAVGLNLPLGKFVIKGYDPLFIEEDAQNNASSNSVYYQPSYEHILYFRNLNSIEKMKSFLSDCNNLLFDFRIISDLDTISCTNQNFNEWNVSGSFPNGFLSYNNKCNDFRNCPITYKKSLGLEDYNMKYCYVFSLSDIERISAFRIEKWSNEALKINKNGKM